MTYAILVCLFIFGMLVVVWLDTRYDQLNERVENLELWLQPHRPFPSIAPYDWAKEETW